MTQRRALPRYALRLVCPMSPDSCRKARREAEAGENFLEFRLDYLPDPATGAYAIAQFLAGYPGCICPGHLPPPPESWPI